MWYRLSSTCTVVQNSLQWSTYVQNTAIFVQVKVDFDFEHRASRSGRFAALLALLTPPPNLLPPSMVCKPHAILLYRITGVTRRARVDHGGRSRAASASGCGSRGRFLSKERSAPEVDVAIGFDECVGCSKLWLWRVGDRTARQVHDAPAAVEPGAVPVARRGAGFI